MCLWASWLREQRGARGAGRGVGALSSLFYAPAFEARIRRMKAHYLALAVALSLSCVACGSDSDSDGDAAAATVDASGTAFAFALPGSPYGLIGDSRIYVLEDESLETTTAEDGTFELSGLTVGSKATFVLDSPDYPAAQTKTFTVPETNLERVTFQVPDFSVYDLLAGVVDIEPDPERCQIVTTVTRVGKSLYDEGAHGEAEALVFSSPMIPAGSGPIYFNESVIPDKSYTESSDDGGVLYTNVEPGVYTLRAEKDGVEFEEIEMTCRGGVLVNASPPYGLQAL